MPLRNMKTWVNGSLVTSADMNAEIRDPINALTPGHEVVTTAEKNAMTGVTTGTMVYDSTLGLLQIWNGSAWVAAGIVSSSPTCEVNRQTGITVPGSGSYITWSTASWDNDAMWNASAPTAITIKTAGLYLCYSHIQLSGNTMPTGTALNIFAGSTFIANRLTLQGGINQVSMTGVVSLAVNDLVRATLAYASGSASITGSTTPSSNQSRMGVVYIGRAA